jgi:hypothetical protein
MRRQQLERLPPGRHHRAVRASHAKLDHVDAQLGRTVAGVAGRLGTLMVVLTGVLFAALHYWPPGHG